MVNFGIKLKQNQAREWIGYYVDYDRLKAILGKEEYSSFSKTGSKNTSGSMFSAAASSLIDHHEASVECLKEEIHKVCEFYDEKMNVIIEHFHDVQHYYSSQRRRCVSKDDNPGQIERRVRKPGKSRSKESLKTNSGKQETVDLKSKGILVPSETVGLTSNYGLMHAKFNSTKGLTPLGKKENVDLKSNDFLVPASTVDLTSNNGFVPAGFNLTKGLTPAERNYWFDFK
jgi:hypothetical protein